MAPLTVSRLALFLLTPLTAGAAVPEVVIDPPTTPLSPEETLKTFHIEDGYRMELVLSEPDIKEPVVAVFDGNGRMFVAEMRTYMQDIDGKKQLDPVSRVSMHEDTNGDGTYDRHTVFIDKLSLPRMILPLDDRLIVCETNTLDFYSYRDTDGDGVADEKKLFYAGGKRGGNLEHQPSGLIWAQDNWLYMTYESYRLRITPEGVIKDSTANNGGQWGLAQDDYGKPWFVNAGGERGPVNFQTHITYGAYSFPGQFASGFEEVWPLVGLADVQPGPKRFRPEDKTLNHFTATCGPEIYRGDTMPDLRGNLLFAEPVGRMIRRATVETKEGTTILTNPYEKSEFIRSTDPNFRPINMVTAPDGSLYIIDMYRGIIQEGNWVREGSYLRGKVKEHQMDKVIGHGRIYRLTKGKTGRGPQPRMLDETPGQLVAHLTHQNGWWRDTAQKLLVLRGDKSVVPALSALARTAPEHLTRIHALWTLDGLGSITPALILHAFLDAHPQVRAAGIRLSEPFMKVDATLATALKSLAKDPEVAVCQQLILSTRRAGLPGYQELITAMTTAAEPVAIRNLAGGQPKGATRPPEKNAFTPAEQKRIMAGADIYASLCAACHGADAKGAPFPGAPAGTLMAPPLAGSKTINGHRDGAINVLLHGLTGPVEGKNYDSPMIPMADEDDEWVASVLSYVRTSFGNEAEPISPQDAASIRKATADRKTPWTIQELQTVIPQQIKDRSKWKINASVGREFGMAIDGNPKTRFDTGTPQKPGMWLQVELPEETRVSGLILDAAGSADDYPRGYEVSLSAGGESWGKPVAAGKGTGPRTEIVFSPQPAKFIRITQTGSVPGKFWSIHDLQIFAQPTGK
jgi:mono/diheme cytochrome c family protein/glucose/arabinose dehydrogenase